MKNKVFWGIFAVLAIATVGMGQTQKTKTADRVADEPSNGNQATLISGTSISAELQKTLDVNNARVGDEVILRTTQSIKHDGQVVVPKGSTLIGRVTEVQRRTKENAQSRLSMIFDRIQGRDLSMPLSATIVTITNASARMAAGDSMMTDAAGSAGTTTSTSGRSSGGGLLGGVGSSVGGVVGTTTQTVGTVTNTAGQTIGTTATTAGRTVNGLTFSAEASGSASSTTTISGPGKTLRFEKGSTFYLRVGN